MSRETFEVTIEPRPPSLASVLAESWHRRDLVYYLIRRDLVVRYKQSLLGIAWALLQPIAMMVVFTFVFCYFAKLPSSDVPYPLFVFAALLPWQLFSSAVSRGAISIVGSSNLVTKVYFPRVIIPVAAVLVPLVDFFVGFLFFLILEIFYGRGPSPMLLFLPIFVAFTVLAALGLSLWLTAIHVRYRDIQHLLPLVLQVLMYMTPVAYATTLVPAQWSTMYHLNPIVSAVDGFRWASLGVGPFTWHEALYPAVITVALLVSGFAYFQSVEGTFSDEI